ncbi:MAG: hypothetical protein F6K28_12845 [Microcoleus sp. SIO2G3]|nr:hypothetical protein [Microcoleus sp. SIO2G3]
MKPLIEDAIAFHHIAHCLQVLWLEVNIASWVDLAVLSCARYSFNLSPNLSPSRREALKLAPFPCREGGWGLGQIVLNSTVNGKGELVAIAFQVKNSFLQAPIHRTTWVSAIDISQQTSSCRRVTVKQLNQSASQKWIGSLGLSTLTFLDALEQIPSKPSKC